MGKRVDIGLGAGTAVSGDIVDVKAGILFVRDDQERVAYVAIEKIAVIWEVTESHGRPGFVI